MINWLNNEHSISQFHFSNMIHTEALNHVFAIDGKHLCHLVCFVFFHRLFVDIFILESNQSFIHLILRMTVHRPGAEKLRLVYA